VAASIPLLLPTACHERDALIDVIRRAGRSQCGIVGGIKAGPWNCPRASP
jgi:hypothetical protein